MCAAPQDLHDPILDGPGNPQGSAKPGAFPTPTSTVFLFLRVGSVALPMSCFPVRPGLRVLLFQITMPAAIMASWIAAGLGSYGFVRYRSLRMAVLAFCAIVASLLSAARFWILVMPD